MANARRRAGFAQKTKLSRFITDILFADDLQCHRALEIDVECFVSDAHGTATQLDWRAIRLQDQFVVLKSSLDQLGDRSNQSQLRSGFLVRGVLRSDRP